MPLKSARFNREELVDATHATPSSRGSSSPSSFSQNFRSHAPVPSSSEIETLVACVAMLRTTPTTVICETVAVGKGVSDSSIARRTGKGRLRPELLPDLVGSDPQPASALPS